MASNCADRYDGIIGSSQTIGEKDKLYVERTGTGAESAVFDLKVNAKPTNAKVQKVDSFNYDDTEALIATEPSGIASARAKECTSGGGGGKLAGVGPNCDPAEIGHAYLHDCIFREATHCWTLFEDCALAVGEQQNQGNVFSTGAPVGHLPYGRQNDKAQCEAAKKDCIKRAKTICTCSDCIYDSCISDCGDDGPDPTRPPVDPTKPTEPTTPTGPTTEYRTVPPVTSVTFTQSQYYVKRPHVYGRFILPGNLFWLGAISSQTVVLTTEEQRGDSVAIIKTTLTVPRASFAIGLCDGPIDAIVRVWLGNTLLFNNTLPTNDDGSLAAGPAGTVIDEIENSVFFTQNSDDPVYYDTSKMKLTFFSGREDQITPAVMGANAPAYRGMAYLLIENFNLAYVGGRLPEIRVEVAKKTNDIFPYQVATLDETDMAGFDPYAWVVDKTTDTIYAPHSDGFRRVAFSTLEEIDVTLNTTFADYPTTLEPSSFMVASDGNLFFQGTSANAATPAYLVDPNSKTLIAKGGVEATTDIQYAYANQFTNYFPKSDRTGKSSLNQGVHAFRVQADGAVITQDYNLIIRSDGFVMVSDTDVKLRKLTPHPISIRGQDSAAFADCVDDFIFDNITNCLILSGCDPEGSSHDPCYISCVEALTASASASCAALVSFYDVFASQIGTSHYNKPIPGVEGGRDQEILGLFMFGLAQGSTQDGLNIKRYRIYDTGIIPASAAYAVDANYDILDDVTIPASAWGGANSNITGQYVVQDVARNAFVVFMRDADGSGIILSVSVDTLAVNWATSLASVPDSGMMAPAPGKYYWFIDENDDFVRLDLTTGSYSYEIIDAPAKEAGTQYFDPFTASILFKSDGTFYKVYVARFEAAATSAADILYDQCIRAHISPENIHVTGLDDLLLDGYIVENDTMPGDAALNICKLFALTAWEDGDGIHFAKMPDVAASATLDADAYGNEGFVETRVDDFTQTASFRFTYADINNHCRPTSQTVKQGILPKNSLNDIQDVQYSAPAVFVNEQAAVNITERMFAHLKLPATRGTLAVGYANAGIQPGDLITINGLNRRVKSVLFSPWSGTSAIDVAEDVAYINDYLAVTIPRNASTGVQTQYDAYTNMAARTFFIPPSSVADAVLAGTTDAVLYFGLVPRNPTNTFERASIGFQYTGVDDEWRDGPELTAPLNLGVCTTTDFDQASSDGTADNETVISVTFDSPSTAAIVTSRITTVDAITANNELNLLLVGREIMQWSSATIDGADPRKIAFSGLLRGRWGTGCYIDSHQLREEVVLITPESFKSASVPLATAMKASPVATRVWAWANVSQTKRIDVTPGSYEGIRHPAPVHIHRYHADNGDIKLTWHGQTIYGNFLQDGLPTNPISPSETTYDDYIFINAKASDDYLPYDETYAVYLFGTFVPGAYRNSVTEPPIDTFQRLIDNRWLNNSSVPGKEILVRGPSGAYIKRSVLNSAGFSQASTFYVVIVRMGGANMKIPGRAGVALFPGGVYPALPTVRSIRTMSLSKYIVLSPGRMIVPKFNRYIVVRPRTT